MDDKIAERDKLLRVDTGGKLLLVLLCELGVLFERRSDEQVNVVLGRADPADVGDEALAAGYTGFMQHVVELATGRTDERDSEPLFVLAGSFTDDHHSCG